jgi:hypothetical protein
MYELERQARTWGFAVPGRESLRIMVSRWENGRVRPDDSYRRLLSRIYDRTPADLGLDESAAKAASSGMDLRQNLPLLSNGHTVGPEVVAHLDAMFQTCAEADNSVGPRAVLCAVAQQVGFIEEQRRYATEILRRQLLSRVVRYAEFAGWLFQDAGSLMDAEKWTNRALDYAHECDDPQLTSYLLMRKSNIASDEGDVGRATCLAAAALESRHRFSPRHRAVVLRQQAITHALADDRAACERKLNQAADEAAAGAALHPDVPDLASYCSPAYVAMEAGYCWSRLGHPANAVGALEAGLASWPAELERDRGLALARLGLAYVLSHDPLQACVYGREAARVASLTASARTAKELRTLSLELRPWRRLDEVAELQRVVSAVAS